MLFPGKLVQKPVHTASIHTSFTSSSIKSTVLTATSSSKEYGIEFVPEWQEMIERNDIDAVVICTHNESHGEIAVAALSAGKHVFMEYPLARYLSQGEQAVSLAKEKFVCSWALEKIRS